MKNIIKFSVLLLLCTTLTITCVSKKKYMQSIERGNKLQDDSAATHMKLDVCNTTVRNLHSDNGELQNQNGDLQDKNGNLQNQNEKVNNDLNNLSNKSKMTIAEQSRRLKNLQDLIQVQRDIMTNLKKNIADALVNFKADELRVYIKDGNVYVALEEKLLFKSGSAEVDPKGKQALAKLSEVLKSTSDINVVIEGYTDNVPIKTGKFADNWALSVSRATSIVRIITIDNGFDPNRITASGQGEYHPVQTNDTPEGRASNRRTEIILSPNLSKLFTLLDQ